MFCRAFVFFLENILIEIIMPKCEKHIVNVVVLFNGKSSSK
jgi:hypothetical protein